ncbi:MAG: ribosome recycling factor [Parcubacteria group bacterium]
MSYNFTQFDKAGESALDWLKKEYTGIRTSRATPSILDGVTVEAYGSKVPINQVATVSVEDPKTLRISPWDKDVAKNIDTAIRESNLGLSVALDSSGLRVSFPELTSERRSILSKLAKEKLEEARIAVRTEREKSLSTIDKEEKEGKISEDDKFRYKAELQKHVDEFNKKLEELFEKKSKEITN